MIEQLWAFVKAIALLRWRGLIDDGKVKERTLPLAPGQPPRPQPSQLMTYSDNIPKRPEHGQMGRFDGTCPDCVGRDWLEGPSGGMSTNIKCDRCGLWLNYVPMLGIAEIIRKE